MRERAGSEKSLPSNLAFQTIACQAGESKYDPGLSSMSEYSPMIRHYNLHCPQCDISFEDDGYLLDCMVHHPPALLMTKYFREQFEPQTSHQGIYRYRAWLPVLRDLPTAGATVTYQSEKLSRVIGLNSLWIAFNGYWPEKGAALETATFKELEAYAVIPRIPSGNQDVMVVASAGNTAAAFAHGKVKASTSIWPPG